MKKYIRVFDTQAEYNSFISGDVLKPNVSYIRGTDEVYYNGAEFPWEIGEVNNRGLQFNTSGYNSETDTLEIDLTSKYVAFYNSDIFDEAYADDPTVLGSIQIIDEYTGNAFDTPYSEYAVYILDTLDEGEYTISIHYGDDVWFKTFTIVNTGTVTDYSQQISNILGDDYDVVNDISDSEALEQANEILYGQE